MAKRNETDIESRKRLGAQRKRDAEKRRLEALERKNKIKLERTNPKNKIKVKPGTKSPRGYYL